MARAAAKGRKRPQPNAQRPAAKHGRRRNLSTAEEALFFSRIRTHAKWAFVVLALVFAGGFVFFGVGTGNSGLGDVFNNLFKGGSSGPSISDAQKRVDKNPQDAKAWKDLATASQDKGRTEDAINAWNTYVSLKPKDTAGLAALAALQRGKAENLQQEAALAQYAQQQAFVGTAFAPPSTTPLGKALGQNPILQAVQSQVSTGASEASTEAAGAFQQAVGTYRQLAALRPKDAGVQLDLAQAAESAADTKTAIAAYERAAQLLPDQAAQIRQRIKQLRSSAAG
jgi:tetratricopeptide (TPR) repeat protein